MLKVLGISGSLRGDSYNSRLLASASRVLPGDAELETMPAQWLRELPHYDEDYDTPDLNDPRVNRVRQAITGADAILWVTPEYNGGLPGVIKNVLDWASRPQATAAVKGTPSAVIGASTGSFGGVWAQDQLRKSLSIARARVVDGEFAVARAHEVLEEHDDVLKADEETALAEILEALVEEARINASLAVSS
jgi:chromate reductase